VVGVGVDRGGFDKVGGGWMRVIRLKDVERRGRVYDLQASANPAIAHLVKEHTPLSTKKSTGYCPPSHIHPDRIRSNLSSQSP